MTKNYRDRNSKLDILMSIVRSYEVLNRYLQIELTKHDTNQSRFSVMSALIVHDGRMTPKAISKFVYRTPHTISSMLDSLEKDGLIRREPNKNDRRSIEIVVTQRGRDDTGRMLSVGNEMSETALSCLDDEQIKTLKAILRQMRRHLLPYI